MAPGVDLTICATPALPLPAWLLAGHLMVELLPSVHALPPPSTRNLEKLAVVPDESERTARTTGVLGRVTPGLSALMAGSFHVLILPPKMPATTGADSCSLLTPAKLYESVIGPIRMGKYSTVLPLKVDTSSEGIGESEPANWTTPEARSARP